MVGVMLAQSGEMNLALRRVSVSQVIRSRFGQTSPSLPRHFRYVIGIQLLVTKNIFFLESLKKIFLKTDQIVHVQLVEVISFSKVMSYSDSDY